MRATLPAFGVLFAISAFPQTAALDRTLDELARTRHFSEVAISPDGGRLAWVEERGRGSAIFVMGWKTAGTAPRRISAGDGKAALSEDHLSWSPDSAQLAFLSNGQLDAAAVPGGAARKLTSVKGYVTGPQWSPDGKQIALLFAENAPGGGGPLEAVPAQTGVIGGAIHNQRITLVDAASGGARQVSPANLNVYEYEWSPDGARFVATAAPGPGDNNWWIAQLYTMAAATGEMRSIYTPPAQVQLATPRWSPDGRTIAFIGGLMSDEGFTGGDIYTIPAAGGEARNRTADRKSSPSWVGWLSPSKLVFTETVGGGGAISTLELSAGQAETLWRGDEDVHAAGNFPNFSLARDGRTAVVVRQSWTMPPEIWAGEIGQWRQITHANAAQHARWGQAKSVTWKNEGFDVQGWLVYPQPYDPAKRYPMVVSVHGGPAGGKKPQWPVRFFDLTVLSGEGYFVFFPNPRGSYGQGEAFTKANVKDFGGGDLRDILAGIDQAQKIASVDGNRVGLTGWSYGGFMSMLAVTKTGRFRAAVAGAGVANWQSYYGENSIDRWMIPYFGASVYDDPAVYAKVSAITFIKNVKTPTLVLVGERDGECPAPQSFEFWHALKTLGMETELVVYAGEGHMFRGREHRRDPVRRTVAWFNRFLK